MQKPYSKKELETIRSLELQQFVNLPILYMTDIAEIFQNVLPRLIDIAEEHAKMCEAIQNQKTNAVQIQYTEDKVIALKSLLVHEERHIAIVVKTAEIMQKQFNKKKEILAGVHLMLSPPWYYRWMQRIKRKSS
jgi:hypothetical protein